MLQAGKDDIAEQLYKTYNTIFDNNFYIEINPQIIDSYNKNVFEKSIIFAKNKNYKIVLANNSYYLDETDKTAHKIFIKIDSDIEADEYYKSYFKRDIYDFKNNKEIEKLCMDCPEAIENSNKIAEQINLELELGK
ncbi:MAG: hypothetical protein QM532_00900 [Cyanobium sp. MAG06]|nr:hypothetical protein [Cyanobium sp. MAG06]